MSSLKDAFVGLVKHVKYRYFLITKNMTDQFIYKFWNLQV